MKDLYQKKAAILNYSTWLISFLLLFLLLSSQNSKGQQKNREYHYDLAQYDSEAGLSHTGIRNIFKDSRNILWILNREGITKYDGSSFTQISMDIGFKRRDYENVVEDKNGNLWFIYYDLLSNNVDVDIYDPQEGKIISIANHQLFPFSTKGIYSVNSWNGQVFIYTKKNELIIFKEQGDFEIIPFSNTQDLNFIQSHTNIRPVFFEIEDKIYVVGGGGELYIKLWVKNFDKRGNPISSKRDLTRKDLLFFSKYFDSGKYFFTF